MTASTYDRNDFGVHVRSTMIFERSLELSDKLCWNSEDLGLSRVHFHNGQPFASRSLLEAYCRERSEEVQEPSYLFDWLGSIKHLSGGARQRYLQDQHWCNREQVVNILLDTALQAYQDHARQLLGTLTGDNFGNAELVKISIKNQARKHTGAPDTVFIDLQNRTIAIVEIKIGKSTTKYSLDQAVKYETLSALLCSHRFFPDFRVHKLLLCPSATFSANVARSRQLGASSDDEGALSFAYDPVGLSGLQPRGYTDISSLVAARLVAIARDTSYAPRNEPNSLVMFYSWRTVEHLAPPGLLRANINALMKYLAPSEAHGPALPGAGV